MLKHTKRQVNEFGFPKCVLLSCLSPQFVCHYLSPNIPKKHQTISKTAQNINMWDEQRDS